MENQTSILNFLKSNGFKLTESASSSFFGDYFDIYSNGEISIRFGSDKSLKTVDVTNNMNLNLWFDLALIMALIKKEQDLTKVLTVQQFNVFLETHLFKICELLNVQNYNLTKKQIEVLEYKRVRQMFPNI